MNDGETAFEGYGYRTSSRFGSWTKVRVGSGTVSITGPRVELLPYRLWTASQVLLLVLILPALLAAAVFWDWRCLLLGRGLLVAHWFVAPGRGRHVGDGQHDRHRLRPPDSRT